MCSALLVEMCGEVVSTYRGIVGVSHEPPGLVDPHQGILKSIKPAEMGNGCGPPPDDGGQVDGQRTPAKLSGKVAVRI